MSDQHRLVMLFCAFAVMITPLFFKGRSANSVVSQPAFSVANSSSTLVSIAGQVKHPGIYSVNGTFLTTDVINMAEPSCVLNTSAKQVKLPLQPSSPLDIFISAPHCALDVRDMASGKRLLLGLPLNINSATAADFELLPGVGKELARRIIECRQKNGGYIKVRDLTAVEGIGEKSYNRLKLYLYSE